MTPLHCIAPKNMQSLCKGGRPIVMHILAPPAVIHTFFNLKMMQEENEVIFAAYCCRTIHNFLMFSILLKKTGIFMGCNNATHKAASVSRFERILHERDYPGMFLDHTGYQKTPLVKSESRILGQEAHQVPQGCPMGPKFLVQKFSHAILE